DPLTNNPPCSGTSILNVTIKPKFDISGPSQGCTGNISNFYAAGGGTANWTISPATGYTPGGSLNNAANIALTWNAAGTYTITATPVSAAGYCTPSATTIIEVYPTPVLNPIVGDLTVCPNQLYNYSVSSNVTGGSFTWSLTPGTIQPAPYGPNGSLASVIFSGTGPWTLQAKQLVNGCTSITNLVVSKVQAPPAITVTSTSICSGGTITASVPGAVPPGGYSWSSSPGAVLVSGQGTASAVFTINDDADITISSCGGSNMKHITATTINVNINPTPGTCSYTLTATPPGGTYAWFLDGNPIGSINPITVTQNGNYVVQATYGSCIVAANETVTNITPVVTTITSSGSLCNNGSVTLTATVSANCAGATYIWSNNATGNPITVTTPGPYWVTVTCSNGCTDQSNTITVACPPGGGSCINDLDISPSDCPNPVALTVTTPAGCSPVSITWNFGEGSSGNTGNHLYVNAGTYTVTVIMKCSDGTFHCGIKEITVPLVAFFTKVVDCGNNGWNIHLQDASTFLPAYGGYTLLWSTSPCGSLSSTNSSNPTVTIPIGCNPTVSLQISKNGCIKTYSFPFNLPTTPLSILGPATVCKGEIISFSSSITQGVLTYAWIFGETITGTEGVTNPISHAYDGAPANPLITLTITDQYGCPFKATKQITVITPAPLVIAPAPLVKICPDCLPPVTLFDSLPAAGYSGYQWYQNDMPIANAN
ncbi:MAG: PKD domain-containing protein, partial [Bacteroidia bacterium]|nr:PKD domain-containing protein [Bacteroidia bacterium]